MDWEKQEKNKWKKEKNVETQCWFINKNQNKVATIGTSK